MTGHPDYVVIRAHPDLPDGFLPDRLEGHWLKLADLPPTFAWGAAKAVPTGRFEYREDGAVAEVYEVAP